MLTPIVLSTQVYTQGKSIWWNEANRRMPPNTAEHRSTQELAGLYEISRILSEIGDFVPKATAAMEKVAALADADWVTLRMPND